MNKIGRKIGLVGLLAAGLLLLTNVAFAMCGKEAKQACSGKNTACTCGPCDCSN